MKFSDLIGRIERNSIYRGESAPEVFEYDKIMEGYNVLGHLKKYQENAQLLDLLHLKWD